MGWADAFPDLAGLPSADRARLNSLTPMDVPAGTVLFQPGETVKGYVLVISGAVDVRLAGPSGRATPLYQVRAGQSCIQSTLGLLGGDVDYSAEAIALEPTRIALLPRADFLGLLHSSEAFRDLIFAAFAGRMQGIMHQMETLRFQPFEARLATLLLELADTAGQVKATHDALAQRLGSAREVVSRHLKTWEADAIVSLSRGTITICDRAALSQQAAHNPAL